MRWLVKVYIAQVKRGVAVRAVGTALAAAALSLGTLTAQAADPPTHHITGTIAGGPRTVTFGIAISSAPPYPTGHSYLPAGPFSIEVPDGTWYLEFYDEDSQGSVGEYYNDAASPSEATPVVVDGSDVDIGAVTLTPLADVHGYNSSPASEVGVYEVEAYPADDYPGGVVRHGTFHDGWHLHLEPGDWKIRFTEAYEGEFPSFWYGGTNSFATASVVHVTGADLDLGLQHVGVSSISGQVRDALGTPVRKVTVTAIDPDGHRYRTDWAKDSGRFSLPFLAAGPYTVQVSDELGQLVANTYYPASPLAAGAVPIEVPADAAVVEQDVVVPRPLVGEPPGTDIAGRVTDQEGNPLQGVGVFAISECYGGSTTWATQSYAVTDADGRYALTHVAEGGSQPTHARLAFADTMYSAVSGGGAEGHDYITEFSGGGKICSAATGVPVGTTDADATLEQYGGLAGSIASVEGWAYRDGDVYVFADAPTQPGGGTYEHPSYRYHWRLDDADPTFTRPQVEPGRYRVLFVAARGGLEHGATWWHQGTDWTSATVVEVRPGEMTTGLDVAVDGQLTQTSPPQVTGTAQVGATLHGWSGTWVAASSITYTGAWLSDGSVVANGWSYQPTSSDVGHALQLRVTATAGGQTAVVTSALTSPVAPAASDPPPTDPGPPPAPPPAPPPTDAPGAGAGADLRTRSTVRATARVRPATDNRPRRAVLDVRVRSAGVPAEGTVTVTEGRRTRAVVALVDGRAVFTLRHLGHRRHHLRVLYSGSERALPGSDVVAIADR